MIYRLMILGLLTLGSLGAKNISLNAAPVESQKPNADLQMLEKLILPLKTDIKTALDQKFNQDDRLKEMKAKAIDKLKLFMKFDREAYELNIEAPEDVKAREMIQADELKEKNEILADKNLYRAFSIVRKVVQQNSFPVKGHLDSLGYKDILGHIDLFALEITDEDRLQIRASLAVLEKLNEVDKISSEIAVALERLKGMSEDIRKANSDIARLTPEVRALSQQLGDTDIEFPDTLKKRLFDKEEELELAQRVRRRADNLRTGIEKLNTAAQTKFVEYLKLRRETVKKLREDRTN